MKYCTIIALLALVACNNEVAPAKKTSETKVEDKSPPRKQKETPIADADINAATIAVLDMGGYIFRVHEVVRFAPDEMQSRMMKWNDTEKDYYVIDGSIENKTGEVQDTGRDMLAAYFPLNDGSVFKSILRGASVLASYNVVNKNKYPQQQYDLIWGSRFSGNGKARSHVFGLEVPEGVTLKGIGFYQKNAAKNKYTDFE
ncbi:MAG TPA: hypothetical protein VJ111_04445 [Chitinophagaceae bacterium]|nr:hypothetical protein [Chitinophagaceae bacterium]